MFDKESANLAADGGSPRDQAVTNPMHWLELQLFARLNWDSPDPRTLHRFGNRRCVEEIVLLRAKIRFDELGRHGPCVVAQFDECPGDEMRRGALFHANQHRFQVTVDSGAKRNRVMKADIDVFAKLAEEGFDG